MQKQDTQRLIEKIRTDYADIYDTMRWLSPGEADKFTEKRNRLISKIEAYPKARWEFSGTKLIARDLSPGCQLCGTGKWSCLFINNICNAQCFYCPASQTQASQPATGRLEFSDPLDYADYVEAFGINGVSFSGGEPLIHFERVMAFLTTLRKKISRPLYIWMYTNGILASDDKFKALADAGLDEIRFDISANEYRLEGLEKAVGIIPKVTVEIPAVPEDLDRFKPMLGNLASAGVDFLNLHQIRCTRFNCKKLSDRGYTFVHGPGVTVLETELAALELVLYTLEHEILLPVNYCAFTFRNQFQRAGAQKRNADQIKASHESITATGQIRTTTLAGSTESIDRIQSRLIQMNTSPALWQRTAKGDQLHIHADLLSALDTKTLELRIRHSGTSLGPSVSYTNAFKKVDLNCACTVVVERFPRHKGIALTDEQIPWYISYYLEGNPQDPKAPHFQEAARVLDLYEVFSPGLAPYF